jgi:lipoprotein NlpI
MKLLSCFVLVAAALILAGCSSNTPAYSSQERLAQIHRNDVLQSEQMNDDIDNDLLMNRPSNQESVWNVYHR